MNGVDASTWAVANQRYVVASLGRLRLDIERHVAGEGDEVPSRDRERSADREVADAQAALPAPAAIETLTARLGLSRFERDVLLLAAGADLDGSFGRLLAGITGEPAATFGLALAALGDAHWSAIAPAGPLRRWRLIELGSGPAITSSPIRIDEWALHYLCGVGGVDERLDGVVERVDGTGELPASQSVVAQQIVRLWSRAERPLPAIQLCGADRAAKVAVAAAACDALGVRLNVIRADGVPTSPAEQETLRTLCERDAALAGGAFVLDADARDRDLDAPALEAAARFADRVRAPLVVASREPLGGLNRVTVRLDLAKPARSEQRDLWLASLGPVAAQANGHLDAVVGQFDLGARSIRAAATAALAAAESLPGQGLGTILWDSSRSQARPRLDDLAQRIEPVATWDDLVVPDDHRRTLREILAHARQRSRVEVEWGFARMGTRGLGISVLFTGPSGTGKTMAAEVLAGELRLDLYRIDLSSVVSKYIGETEKNLRRVFDAAEDGAAILLFDEADALFGKRTEVKDSHDRYANIEVGYLLQRMEAYRGLAILTTNVRNALDTAFVRRLRFIVQFPFPDPAARAEIWRRIFPAETPQDGLRPETLARLNVTGGSIRNIALGAAVLAADAGQPVGMPHLLQAARSEYAKLEKPLTEAEIGGWT